MWKGGEDEREKKKQAFLLMCTIERSSPYFKRNLEKRGGEWWCVCTDSRMYLMRFVRERSGNTMKHHYQCLPAGFLSSPSLCTLERRKERLFFQHHEFVFRFPCVLAVTNTAPRDGGPVSPSVSLRAERGRDISRENGSFFVCKEKDISVSLLALTVHWQGEKGCRG